MLSFVWNECRTAVVSDRTPGSLDPSGAPDQRRRAESGHTHACAANARVETSRLGGERRRAQSVRVTRDREWWTPDIRRRCGRRSGSRSREETRPRETDEPRRNLLRIRVDGRRDRARGQLDARARVRRLRGLRLGGARRATAAVVWRRSGARSWIHSRLKRHEQAVRLLQRQQHREQNRHHPRNSAQAPHRFSRCILAGLSADPGPGTSVHRKSRARPPGRFPEIRASRPLVPWSIGSKAEINESSSARLQGRSSRPAPSARVSGSPSASSPRSTTSTTPIAPPPQRHGTR